MVKTLAGTYLPASALNLPASVLNLAASDKLLASVKLPASVLSCQLVF